MTHLCVIRDKLRAVMNKKPILVRKQAMTVDKREIKQARSVNYPLIKEAVARAVREYGKTLEKLAKDD